MKMARQNMFIFRFGRIVCSSHDLGGIDHLVDDIFTRQTFIICTPVYHKKVGFPKALFFEEGYNVFPRFRDTKLRK